MKVICPNNFKCNNEYCPHKKPHTHSHNCDNNCDDYITDCQCVPSLIYMRKLKLDKIKYYADR